MEDYEYKTESALLAGGRVKASFRYPVGGAFGDFYAELAKKCQDWLTAEYSECSEHGLTYVFFAETVYSECGIYSVILQTLLRKRGVGKVGEMYSAQNWLDGGRLLPIYDAIDKKAQKRHCPKQGEYFIVRGDIFILAKTGEKISTGVKIGNLSQEILSDNLKNRR